jgi:hypothetical protein
LIESCQCFLVQLDSPEVELDGYRCFSCRSTIDDERGMAEEDELDLLVEWFDAARVR